jgi:tetratricopeptide (TPR) repeat protein
MKILIHVCLWYSVILSSIPSGASPYLEISPELRQGYQFILNLRLEEAQVSLKKAKSGDPDNMLVHYFEDYIDFISIFIHEDKAAFNQQKSRKYYRISQIKTTKPDNPYYLLAIAEIHFHWAVLSAKFGDYFSSASEMNRAFRLLKKNEKRFPDFIPNFRVLGLMKAGVGTIPDKYQWLVRFFTSMEGTISEGMKDLEKVIAYSDEEDFIFRKETQYMYALTMHHFNNDSEGAWQFLQSKEFNPKDNPLDCFLLANVAMKTGRNDQAISILSEKPNQAYLYQLSYLDLMLGSAKLYRLDSDADKPLKKFIRACKGQNYIKEAYQKLGWHYLLLGDQEGYDEAMDNCIKFGAHIFDEDQHALREAKRKLKPHPLLLKSRLLFDGGYYQDAINLLEGNDIESFKELRHQIEMNYRLARVYHQMNERKKALEKYRATIEKGRDLPWYFACNAALQAGLIHENAGDTQNAISHFKLCLSMKPEVYEKSLHQKAKAGINRLMHK